MLDRASPEYALADNLWSKGKGHLHGALALEQVSRTHATEHGMEDIDEFVFSGLYSVSLHLLLGFAAELLTKAAYILHGGSPEFVKKWRVGHDLIALLDAAGERGFVALEPRTREIFELLRKPHQDHQFRYGDEEEVPMPDLLHTLPALQMMSNQVQEMLEAAPAGDLKTSTGHSAEAQP